MDEHAASEGVTVYSDYVCPFCYLGKRVLVRYLDQREEPLDVEWRPFDLRARERGENELDSGKDEAYYEQARKNVRRLQEEYDIDMAEELRHDVDSWNAQQASLYVREEHPEQWEAFDEAVFETLWVEGRDVGDVDVLAQIAADTGIDPGSVREAVDDDAWADRLEAEFAAARDAGISGVPTWIADGRVARGAVPPERLERLIEGEG